MVNDNRGGGMKGHKWAKISVGVLFIFLMFIQTVNAAYPSIQEIKQLPISDSAKVQYINADNYTDFMKQLADIDSDFNAGVYAGPHFPPVYIKLKYVSEIRIITKLSLSPDVFGYGASDYYLYIPILNDPSTIQMLIFIEDAQTYEYSPEPTYHKALVIVKDDYFKAFYENDPSLMLTGANYSTLYKFGLVRYDPSYGYFFHPLIFPLVANKDYVLEIDLHFVQQEPLKTLFAVDQDSLFGDTVLQTGDTFLNTEIEYISLSNMKSYTIPPLAYAMSFHEGLSACGIGGVALPPNLAMQIKFYVAIQNNYSTLEMPFYLYLPAQINIEWDYKSGNVSKNESHDPFVKHFILDSTAYKVDGGGDTYDGPYYCTISSESNFVVFVNPLQTINLEKNVYFISSSGKLSGNYAKAIIFNLESTENRYVALNSTTWTISREEFVKIAKTHAAHIFFYEFKHAKVLVAAPLFHMLGDYMDEKDAISITASRFPESSLGFKINFPEDPFAKIIKVIKQIAIKIINVIQKIWNWFTNGLSKLFEITTFFVIIITGMLTLKYISKALRERRDVREL